jgi:ATP-dependent Clp protease ATP-binding subunit ClpC
VFEDYSKAATQSLFIALMEAGRLGAEVIGSELLLLGLVRVDPVTLQDIDAPRALDWAMECATAFLTTWGKRSISEEMVPSGVMRIVFEKAREIADTQGCLLVRTEHLLLSLMTTTSRAAIMLQEFGASVEHLQMLVSDLHGDQQQEIAPWPTDDLFGV